MKTDWHDLTDADVTEQLRRRAATGTPATASVLARVRDSGAPTARNRRAMPVAIATIASATLAVIGLAIFGFGSRPAPTPTPTAIAASPTPSPSPSPTGELSPTLPPAPAAITCGGDPIDSATVLDSTGLVGSCIGGQMDFSADPAVIFNMPDDPTVTVVGVPMSLCFGPAMLTLEPAAGGRFTGSLVEQGGLKPGCSAGSDLALTRTISLQFAEPIDASLFTINGWSLADEPPLPPLSSSDSDVQKDFTLTLSAPETEFPANEPINGIDATLVYSGPEEQVDVLAGYRLIEGWSLEQLDGPIDTRAVVPLPCRGYSLERGVPLVEPFGKSGGYSQKDPLFEFWQGYFADPELRLPPGTWKITVGSSFSFSDCGERSIGLSTSIVIRTVGPLPPP